MWFLYLPHVFLCFVMFVFVCEIMSLVSCFVCSRCLPAPSLFHHPSMSYSMCFSLRSWSLLSALEPCQPSKVEECVKLLVDYSHRDTNKHQNTTRLFQSDLLTSCLCRLIGPGVPGWNTRDTGRTCVVQHRPDLELNPQHFCCEAAVQHYATLNGDWIVLSYLIRT